MTDAIIYRRYSTDEQELGDSMNRQKTACEALARKHGWTIIERLDDPGLSAYKNEHIERGELGKLTQRVENEELETGTIIIAEKLDRLSRRQTGEAMGWIWTLTQRGVKIAIADSGEIYDENLNIGTFISAAITADQNNKESKKKSVNVLAAKRSLWAMAENRTGKWVNLAARPPLWLMRKSTLDGWDVDDERKAIITDIYKWSADGLGAQSIARRLNESGTNPWGVWRKYSATWGLTAINQLLRNRAVEGDYIGKSGEFKGRVIAGFYPTIVDADLVARARSGMTERRKVKGQRARNGVSGLFSGLTVCGECGHSAFLTSHIKRGKKYRYLRCEGARQANGCNNGGYYSYAAFEETALDLCLDLALDDRFFEVTGAAKRLMVVKAENDKQIGVKKLARGRLLKYLEDGDDQMLERIRSLKLEIDELIHKSSEIDLRIQSALGKVGALEHLNRVNEIRESARSEDEYIREIARSKLQKALKVITNSVAIEIDNNNEKVFTLALVEGIIAIRIDTKGRIVSSISDAIGMPIHKHLSIDKQILWAPLIKRINEKAS